MGQSCSRPGSDSFLMAETGCLTQLQRRKDLYYSQLQSFPSTLTRGAGATADGTVDRKQSGVAVRRGQDKLELSKTRPP